jgi:hypothetical protein
MGAELRQGEIITGLVHHSYNVGDDGIPGFDIREVPYVVLWTQDCDLYKDYRARHSGTAGILSGALLLEAQPGDAAKAQLSLNRHEWKQATNNIVQRFHHLVSCPPGGDLRGVGFPDLLVDFRRYFTLSPREIERQVAAGSAVRRCRLSMPYRTVFQNRAGAFNQRFALPDEYDT